MATSSVAITAPWLTAHVGRGPTATLELSTVVATSIAVATGARLVPLAVQRAWILVS